MYFHDRPGFMRSRRRGPKIAFAILIGIVFFLVFGTLIQLLWNWVMPVVTGAGPVSFWQALGLLILARLLVGGFHHAPHRRLPFKRRESWRQYEDWWREVGEQSFREYAGRRRDDAGTQGGM